MSQANNMDTKPVARDDVNNIPYFKNKNVFQ